MDGTNRGDAEAAEGDAERKEANIERPRSSVEGALACERGLVPKAG